jgi:hypothetical protein
MLRRCLALIALIALTACADELSEDPTPTPQGTPAVVQSVTAEPTPEPDATPEETTASVAEETPGEPSAAVVPVLEGEPFQVDENPSMPQMSDRFVFWGWSKDGLRYAFETYNPGEGAVSCDMRHDVYVVDAETDKYAEGGHITIAHKEVEPVRGPCDPVDLAPRGRGAADCAVREARHRGGQPRASGGDLEGPGGLPRR